MHRRNRTRMNSIAIAAALASAAACTQRSDPGGSGDKHDHGSAPAAQSPPPTNRVDIPASVRQNLGVTFAKVESRNVAQTVRVPGQFELLPTARREYRAPLPGRVELLVAQYQEVAAGLPLYRVDSAPWRELHEQIAAMEVRVNSMGPLREAMNSRRKTITDTVTLWQGRLKQLDELRAAGGGSASQFTDARATLNAAEAELSTINESSVQLQAQQSQAESELRSLKARRDVLNRSGHCGESPRESDPGAVYTVCAASPGIVEGLSVTTGGLVEENSQVLAVVQPEQIRFRARGLQSDLGRLRNGLPVRIVPPQGGAIPLQDVMTGTLQLGLIADPDERTIDLVAAPAAISAWARAGVAAHMEVTLAGGSDELAIPLSAVVRDGITPVIFRRDPGNPDKVIRMEADLGVSDGRWIVIGSGVKEGDEIVVGGNFQLMLATSGSAPKGGHFHSDGTFHEGEDK